MMGLLATFSLLAGSLCGDFNGDGKLTMVDSLVHARAVVKLDLLGCGPCVMGCEKCDTDVVCGCEGEQLCDNDAPKCVITCNTTECNYTCDIGENTNE